MKVAIPAAVLACMLLLAAVLSALVAPRSALAETAGQARAHQECTYLQQSLDHLEMARHELAQDLSMGDNHPDIRSYSDGLSDVYNSLGGVMKARCPGFGH